MGSDNELFEKVKGIIVEQLGANAEAVKMEASNCQRPSGVL